ncbi:MAG: hypothetical protein ACRD8Z_18855, partial [Nitrososphaeraceae archaeon]
MQYLRCIRRLDCLRSLISLILGFHGNALDYGIAIFVVSASYFMALATYIYNDIVDFEVDKLN